MTWDAGGMDAPTLLDPTDPHDGAVRVGVAARVLGFAGLIPPLIIVVLLLLGRTDSRVVVALRSLATVYAATILSFLGGVWWGFAMRRARDQALLTVAAIVPSLVAAGLLALAGFSLSSGPTIVLGVAIVLTLPVDYHLAATGEAPAGWMRLRVPLSVGLGLLTIAAGMLAG